MTKINIQDLFEGIQEQMKSQLSTNRGFINHPGSKGDSLEEVWISWLKKYLPDRYCVDKAIVIDKNGSTSHQIDIVIYDQIYTPFVLNQNGFKYIPAEGVYAVFEVKPDIKGSVANGNSGTINFIQYTGQKIESVRKLNRTSTGIINAGKLVKPRALTEIVGGIVSSTNTIVKPETLTEQIKSLKGLQTIDLACAIDFGTVIVEYDNPFKGVGNKSEYQLNSDIKNYYNNRKIQDVHFGSKEKSLITFFLKLMEYLQQRIGTVAAIDLNAYLNA